MAFSNSQNMILPRYQAEMDQVTTHLDVDDNNDKIFRKTLMNPLIVHKVFSFLDTTTLKSVRLVCPTWADVGAGFLGKKGRLTFSTSPNLTNCKELTLFHHKLAKNITLYMQCNCIYGTRCSCSPDERQINRSLPPNFSLVLPHICDKLDTLHFIIERTYQPNLYEMWSTYHFRNLVTIRIDIRSLLYLNQVDLGLPEITQFRPLPSLKVFHLCVTPIYEKYFCWAVLSSVCQGLLNSAPNLEEFSLTGSFYPDLTPCRELKKLKYSFNEYRDLFTEDIVQTDLSSMTRMLENRRNSLEELKLDYNQYPLNIIEWGKLNFHFPNLTHLTIDEAGVYHVEDSLNIAHLPKLTHFSITALESYSLSDMFANYNLRHIGITSLDVGCVHKMESENQDIAAAAKLVYLFPAVKDFKFKLKIEVVEDFSSLKETLESFGGWDLTHGQVEIEHDWDNADWLDIPDLDSHPEEEFDSEVVLAVLDGLIVWRGVANTSLQFNGCRPDAKLKLTDRMRAFLLATRGTIRTVVFEKFQFDEETAEAFRAFIGDNNLPISCTNANYEWSDVE